MRRPVLVVSIVVAIFADSFIAGSFIQNDSGGGNINLVQGDDGKGATVKEEVRGGIAFRPEKRT